MAIPKPGKPVRGSQSGAPIMALFDLLGRRWAMGVVWQLSNGPLTFVNLQRQCTTISPSVLNSRIKDLTEANLIGRTLEGYQLTELGQELFLLIKPLGNFSRRWAKKIGEK